MSDNARDAEAEMFRSEAPGGQATPTTDSPRSSTELAEVERIPPDRWGGGAGIAWLAEYERMAMSRAIVLPKGIRDAGDPRTAEGRASIAATALAVGFAGREFGLGFMAATRLIHVIDGKTSPAAELVIQRARERGHDIVAVHHTPRCCRVTCISCSPPAAQQVEWALTEADATRPEAIIAERITTPVWEGESGSRKKVERPITTKDNWRNYGHDMLFWRAGVELVRRHCSEATGGMHTVEELS